MAATVLLAVLLLETAVETFWHGSPIRWWVLAAVACWALLMVPAALFLGWGGRLWLTVLALMGLVVFAVWRVGAAADPALAVLTLSLPRVLSGLSAVAVVLTLTLLVRTRFVQRLPWLMAFVILLGMYCFVPFVFAFIYATPFEGAIRGAGYWTTPPLWLQGAYLGLQLVMPVGILLSAVLWLWAASSRARRSSAVLPAVSLLIGAATFGATSIAFTRAGVPNLAARLMAVRPGVPESAPAAASGGAGGSGAVNTTIAPTEASTPAPGRTATTRAVELSIENVELVAALGDRTAPPGQTFVVVHTAWRNVIQVDPAGQTPAEPAPYLVPSLVRHLWLLADSRTAEPIDEPATHALARHLPMDTLSVPSRDEVIRGAVVFRAAANASYLALLLMDAKFGDALVTVKGRPADAPAVPLAGTSKQNEALALVATEAGWSETAPAPPPGTRYYTLGLRGTGRSPDDLVMLDLTSSGFLQTEQGFVAEPEQATWLRRPFSTPAVFLRQYANEGQLAFLLPADTQKVRFLLRPRSGGPIDLPVTGDFAPAWPQPVGVITDGATLRVLRLPPPALPADLPSPPAGRRYLGVDVLVENLRPTQALEFQIARQLRVLDANG
ncbi:MAG: hypothetical protein IMZ67_06885, partial [Acidobacteria bacterium]|nr:hypothetical protein [Acidobacteriota bacterium]